jgi:transposase
MRYLLADRAEQPKVPTMLRIVGTLGCGGYDADQVRRSLRDAGAVPIVPGRRNRKRIIRYDKGRYRSPPPPIENALCRLKDFRRVATRYDKPAANFLSGLALATALAFWL